MISLEQIARVKNSIQANFEGPWADVESTILLEGTIDDSALTGLDSFSHLEVIFYFDKLNVEKVCRSTRHPKDNPAWPLTGIYAQRGSLRPNLLGASIVKIISVKENQVIVRGLDAYNGTPVLDLKPVMKEFLPDEIIVQPQWSSELMKNYFYEKGY